MIGRRSLLLAGAALPASAYGQCVTDARTVDACRGGVRNAPPYGQTLALDFLTPGTLDPRITFTRASTGTYTDSAGVIQTAAINAPRWDYAGGVLRGLLIEEPRTNVLLNSATLGTQSVAVTAQAYTLSFYGTGTITKSGTATGALVGTGVGQRVSQTFTPTAGTLTCTVTGSVTNAQIEAGGFATSYIQTTAAAVTRAFDLCVIPPAAMTPWFASPGGTWLAEFSTFDTSTTNNSRIIGQPVSGSVTQLFKGGGNVIDQYDGAFLATSNTVALNTVSKAASSWAGGQGKICLNGASVATGAMPTGYASMVANGVSFMNTGGLNVGEILNGYIRRANYWPRVLTDAEMQRVTS